MGFFLEAANRRGVGAVEGIEISSYAASYCRTKLGIPVVNSSFDDAAIKTAYDVITAWYFIEHCVSPLKTAMKIHALLKPGGMWAFSTPSSFGPLYAFHRKEWASRHPGDHRVDFSPASVKGFLKRAGFSRVVVRAGGIHPERVFPEGCFYSRPLGPFMPVFPGSCASPIRWRSTRERTFWRDVRCPAYSDRAPSSSPHAV